MTRLANRKPGFSYIELLTGLIISALIINTLITFMLSWATALKKVSSQAELVQQAVCVLEVLKLNQHGYPVLHDRDHSDFAVFKKRIYSAGTPDLFIQYLTLKAETIDKPRIALELSTGVFPKNRVCKTHNGQTTN